MIIVIEDDQTVTVLPDLESVRLECEAVDVEDGAYRFFDEFGRHLVPRFIASVQRESSLLGAIKTVGNAVFELELEPQDRGSYFEESLSSVVAINPNPNFATIADLARYVDDIARETKPDASICDHGAANKSLDARLDSLLLNWLG